MSEERDYPRHAYRQLVPSDFVMMNLPEAYRGVRRDGVQPSNREVVERYIDNIVTAMERPAGLWILGAEGVGKTAFAAIIAKAARAHRFTVWFTDLWGLQEDLRVRDDERHDDGVLTTCRKVDLLVIDALRESDAESKLFGRSQIVALIRHRCNAGRATVVTSRLTAREINAVFDGIVKSTGDRMAVVPMKGEDMRAKARDDLKSFLTGGS